MTYEKRLASLPDASAWRHEFCFLCRENDFGEEHISWEIEL